MVQRRRPLGFAGAAQRAHSHDPAILRGVMPNDPYYQPDIAQFGAMDREIAKGMPSIVDLPASRASDNLNSATDFVTRTVPTRIEYVTWTCTIFAASTPTLLIPRNAKRLSMQLPNHFALVPGSDNGIFYSWGFPVLLGGGAVPYGGVVAERTRYTENGVTTPINDLYVWLGVSGQTTIVAYEGIEAVEQP